MNNVKPTKTEVREMDRMAELNSTIRKAITNKKAILFAYGEDSGSRIVLPHCLYLNNRSNYMLDGYQDSGFSLSGNQGWKQFLVSGITYVEILEDRSFQIQKGFNPKSKRYDHFIEIVK